MKAEPLGLYPWEPVAKTGWEVLDCTVPLPDPHGSVTVTRNRMEGTDAPGQFVVRHVDRLISNRTHKRRPQAIAEAERYIASIPEFSRSKPSLLILSAVGAGKAAHDEGKPIHDNPFRAGDPAREHWSDGWLEAYVYPTRVALYEAVELTKRAIPELQRLNAAIEYALALAADNSVGNSEEYRNFRAVDFLRAFRSDDIGRYPDWKDPLPPTT